MTFQQKMLCALAAVWLFAGCSASNPFKSSDTIVLESAKKTAAADTQSQFNFPVTLRVAKFQDGRRNANSRRIGDIKSNVMGMSGPDLVVEDDVANLVTAAMKKSFEVAGFQVVDSVNAQFEVVGAVKEFSLNIADRDELAMVVEATLREVGAANGGSVIWSGVVTEKNDRFAGVMGNSKKDVVKYLDRGLGTVSQKTTDAIAASLKQVHPEMFNQMVANQKAMPGVSVLIAPQPQAPPPAPVYAAPAAAGMMAAQPAALPASGYLSITTTPSRVKVYVDDVYYGLSPIKLELDAGVHAVRFKADGYKAAGEKVSVRRHETTELEMTLEK